MTAGLLRRIPALLHGQRHACAGVRSVPGQGARPRAQRKQHRAAAAHGPKQGGRATRQRPALRV